MKWLILLLFTNASLAAPFIESDFATDQPTFCGIYIDTLPKVEVAITKNTTGKSYCRYDIGSLTVGQHNIKLTHIVKDPVWGVLESEPTLPFAFSRPAPPTTPVGLEVLP